MGCCHVEDELGARGRFAGKRDHTSSIFVAPACLRRRYKPTWCLAQPRPMAKQYTSDVLDLAYLVTYPYFLISNVLSLVSRSLCPYLLCSESTPAGSGHILSSGAPSLMKAGGARARTADGSRGQRRRTADGADTEVGGAGGAVVRGLDIDFWLRFFNRAFGKQLSGVQMTNMYHSSLQFSRLWHFSSNLFVQR